MRLIDPATDPWRSRAGSDPTSAQLLPYAHALLTPDQWRSAREHWPAALAVGVVLANTDEVDELAGDLSRFALVALQFPKWTDGRAYSQARLLRVRHRFAGELRATGEVLADMLPVLQRCGVDAAQLRTDQDLEVARQVLGFFAGHYQGDALQPQPIFRRRSAGVPVVSLATTRADASPLRAAGRY